MRPLWEGPAKAHKRREKSTAVCGIRTHDLLFTFCSLMPRIFEPKSKCEDCFTFFLIPAKLFCHRALLSQAKKSSFFSHKMIFCKMLSKKGGFLMSFEIKETFLWRAIIVSSFKRILASPTPPPHPPHTHTHTTHTHAHKHAHQPLFLSLFVSVGS